MNPMYTILIGGTDCDGSCSNQSYFDIFYSRKVAEFFAKISSDWSNGLTYSVITIDELIKNNYDNIIEFREYRVF